MRKRAITVVLGLVVLGLLAVNIKVASAHNWWYWHWDKKIMGVMVFGTGGTQSLAAVNDWRSRLNGILYFPAFSSHTDISVFGGNYGATGWWGLASIESYVYSYWGWGTWCWCGITHAHARYNSYYGGTAADIQGVQCQEFGHTLGLDHSSTGDCMGKGYYNNSNVTSSHNRTDIYSIYP